MLDKKSNDCEGLFYRIKYKPELKAQILKIVQRFRLRGRWTAGYRRIQMELDQIGLYLAGDTISKLIRELNVQVSLYNRHRNGKYSSYHGTVGKIADNRLNIAELTELSQEYVQYFNHVRTTLKTKGMTSVEYRNHALAA